MPEESASAGPSPSPSSLWGDEPRRTACSGSKSASAATLELGAAADSSAAPAYCESVRLASGPPFNDGLKRQCLDAAFDRVHFGAPPEARPDPDPRDTCCGPAAGAGPPAGRFRYVVASMVLLGVTFSAYASNTMYIAAIEMVSNDVLQSGITALRAQHLSNDPLAANANAALPGTCPVETQQHSSALHALVSALVEDRLQIKLPNASEISAHEQLALRRDTDALLADIDRRLDSGKLVNWTIQERGYVFTAHALGTILMAVPVSRLGLAYGSKAVVSACICLATLRMSLLPTVAGRAPFWATFAFELVIGGAGGNLSLLGYPLAAAWLLVHEANFFVAIVVLGALVGPAATNFISTQMLANGLDWAWCYYLPGIMMGLLGVCWLVLGADRPEASRFVSAGELELLRGRTPTQRAERQLSRAGSAKELDEKAPLTARAVGRPCRCAQEQRAECPANKLSRKPNWSTIFSCPSVWAISLVAFANHWTTKNSTFWPTFFANILHIDSSTIGIALGIKGVWALVFGTLFAVATRRMVVERPFNMSLTAYRRWNYSIATALFAVSVALMAFMDCSLTANFASLLIQPVVSSFNSVGPDQMVLDLAAEDSGLVTSVIRLVSVGDIVALPVSSYILSHAEDALAGDRTTWRIVWLIGLTVRVVTGIFFVLVARSEPKVYSRIEPSGPCKSSSDAKAARLVVTTSDGYLPM